MRLLHTSDWHLGRSFHKEGLLGAQADYVDHLLEVVERARLGPGGVGGGVVDPGQAHVDAVGRAPEAFARLASSRARVVVSSGNHDSAQRLGFGSRLADAAGVHVRTDPATVGTPVVLADDHGEVVVHALPYLDPDLLREPWSLGARSHESALGEAMRRVRADLRARRPGTRSVVLAHAFVAGCQPSDSERDISVGGVSMVPASLFDDVSYAALGHLHGRQTLSETVRYSGSPLAYSFSEAGHRKGSWLVELGAGGLTAAEFVDAPVPRRLARLSGTLDQLLTDPSHASHEDDWVEATLTDDVRPLRAMDRLRRRFPHALQLAFAPTTPAPTSTPSARTEGRSDHQIALDFVRELRGHPADDAESALLLTAVEACCGDD